MSPTLQDCVSRLARSLTVPTKLLALHPRARGNSGKHAALSPAITLSALSAFEGFAEDFTATALYLNGDGFGQIAQKVGKWNNPTVGDFASRMASEFAPVQAGLGRGFSLDIYRTPALGASTGWQNPRTLTWADLLRDAEAWMQVRHCLAHGQATGWQSERWPASIRKGSPAATTVLRPMKNGKHSLALHGALSCARLYVAGGRHVADLVATTLGVTLDWAEVPMYDRNRLGPAWP